jgi:ATP synthase F1 delta subunit
VTRNILARKYASGLFAAGDRRHELDGLYDEAESLLAYLRQERSLLAFLTAPQIRDQDKEQVVRDSFASRVSATFLSFLLLLVRKHRIGHLDDILDHFIGMVKERRGILPTKVLTAAPLSGDERDRLVTKLERKTGKKIELTVVEDPSLVGGLMVILGNRVIDYSLRHYLRELRERLLAIKVH